MRTLSILVAGFFVLIVLPVSAALIVGSLALVEDQMGELRLDVARLESKVDDLQQAMEGFRSEEAKRQSFEQSGPCSPAINRLIVRAWQGSSREIPIEVVQRLVHRESSCNPLAVSPSNARGLMQVKPAAAMSLGYDPEAMLDAATGLEAGIAYLDLMLHLSGGDLEQAINRYHHGPSGYRHGETSVAFARGILNQK